MAVSDDLRAAYSATGADWQSGPTRIYDRLAEVLVERAPVPVAGAAVVDVGAGTGAAGRAARRAGARFVIAADLALGMLVADPERSASVVTDARALAARDAAVDLAIAAFSLNHVDDPASGLREVRRVVRPGGGIVVGAYAADDTHPVKEVVEVVLRRFGWEEPPWIRWMRADAVPRLADVAAATAVAEEAGLEGALVEHLHVPFPALGPGDLVAWRLGMAQHAPFVAALGGEQRADLLAEAAEALGASPPVLVRSLIVLTAVVPEVVVG